jgi:hypothetical protein
MDNLKLGQAGGTPLSMRQWGHRATRISRRWNGNGSNMPQDQAMMQPQQQMGPPLEVNYGSYATRCCMMQEGGQEQTALVTIIQLLIEQGVPPEQAQELSSCKFYKYLLKVVHLLLKHLQIN